MGMNRSRAGGFVSIVVVFFFLVFYVVSVFILLCFMFVGDELPSGGQDCLEHR